MKNGASINEVEEKEKFTPVHTACNVGALEVSHIRVKVHIMSYNARVRTHTHSVRTHKL